MKTLKKLIEAIFQIANDLSAIRKMMEQKEPMIIEGQFKPLQYSDDFEKIWQLYGDNLGSKERAYKIFLKKWINTDIQIIENGINTYLHIMKESKTLHLKRYFENFLHQSLEMYIDKKN